MNIFPEIEGVEWVTTVSPSLVKLPITLVDREAMQLDLKEIPEMEGFMFFDLAKLSAIKDYYPKGEDTPSKTKCVADFTGIDSIELNLGTQNLLDAWIFHKTWFQ